MYIKLKVVSGAKMEKIDQIKPDEYRIWVREPAERNLANQRVKELIARELGVSASAVRMVSGHHDRSKIVSILNS